MTITLVLLLFRLDSASPSAQRDPAPKTPTATHASSEDASWPSIVAACLGVLVGGALAMRRIRSARD